MRGCRSALAVVVFACSLVPASAGETGLYVSAHGGVSFPKETDSVFAVPGPVTHNEIDAEDGYRAGGAVGWIFSRYLSAEVELTYSSHDVDTVTSFIPALNLAVTNPGLGSSSSLSGMVNGYVSLPLDGGWRPYVGGGLGYTRLKSESIGIPTDPARTSDSDGAFSWQLMAGVGYEIAPDLELGTRYRFQHTDEVTQYSNEGREQLISDTEAHSVEVTLTWKLDRSEPTPLK